jgi:hypothetical protein
MARGCYGGWELTAGAPREKGALGNLTVGEGGQHGGRSEAGNEEQWRRQMKLDGVGVRVAEDGK